MPGLFGPKNPRLWNPQPKAEGLALVAQITLAAHEELVNALSSGDPRALTQQARAQAGALDGLGPDGRSAAGAIRAASWSLEEGHPQAETLITDLRALGLRIQARAAERPPSPAEQAEIEKVESAHVDAQAAETDRAKLAELRERVLSAVLDNPIADWLGAQSRLAKIAVALGAALAGVVVYRRLR